MKAPRLIAPRPNLWFLAATLLLLLRPAPAQAQRRFELADIGRLVSVGDPQLSPDGRQILIVVSRPNFTANRHDAEVVLVDVASGRQRVLIAGRPTVKQPRWSPTGDRVAFLARTGSGKDAHTQLLVQALGGPDQEARQLTTGPTNVQHFRWSPDGATLAYTAADAPANQAEIERGNDSFEVGDGSVTLTAAPAPDQAAGRFRHPNKLRTKGG